MPKGVIFFLMLPQHDTCIVIVAIKYFSTFIHLVIFLCFILSDMGVSFPWSAWGKGVIFIFVLWKSIKGCHVAKSYFASCKSYVYMPLMLPIPYIEI